MVWPWRTRRRWKRRPRRWRRWRWPRRNRKRRTYTRRRTVRASRKRRKRRKRTRVRKKKPLLNLKQWQPESIKLCKIIGHTPLNIGCNGRQIYNYTYWQDYYIHPKCPSGGGFSVYKWSLAYLYEDYCRRKNIWTKSNCPYDLCRYLGTRIKFYSHPEVDYVATYSRNYPMVVDETTYMLTHPSILLLRKHRVIIPSRKTKPNGRGYKKIFIKPPRQLINKWFFQKQFNDQGLFLLQIAAADLQYPTIGPNSPNRLVTLNILNNQYFYGQPNWGDASGNYTITQGTLHLLGKNTKTLIDGKLIDYVIPNDIGTQQKKHYYDSGLFNRKMLNIQYYTETGLSSYPTPTMQVQYNPMRDTGKGNKIYFISTLQTSWGPPTTDRLLFWQGEPLWLQLYGLTDYILKAKGTSSALQDAICVIESPWIEPQTHNKKFVVIGNPFMQGQTDCKNPPTGIQLNKWFLTLEDQMPALNDIVTAGPYMVKQTGFRCTWEMHVDYKSYFKWGGAQPPLQNICDPHLQETFPVPDTVRQTLQIIDPKKQVPESLLHSWDYRRGLVTQTALKRMYKGLSDAESSSADTSEESDSPQRKRKRGDPPCPEEKDNYNIQTLKEICQTPQEAAGNIEQQLHNFQQQQYNKNINILKLLAMLKQKQLQMQLAMGMME
nr:MAG: ORF1 [Torque teno midi virus]